MSIVQSFYFPNHKYLIILIWSVALYKIISVIFTWSPILNLDLFYYAQYHHQCVHLNISRLHIYFLWYVLLYLSPISFSLTTYTFCWYCIHMLVDLTLQSSDKSFSSNIFSFVVCWIHFSTIVMLSRLHWSIVKLISLI